ncbi:hypothetical protein ACFLYU_00310 [Candidatus Dependentiae bacterium]
MRVFIVLILLIYNLIYNITIISGFPKIKLKDVDIDSCRLVKAGIEKGAARAVYAAVEKGCFFKIWDANFWRCRYFLQGLQSGFYDENNTPLVAVIYDEGCCRGYVTRVGLRTVGLTDGRSLLPIEKQKDKRYIDFYYDLLERTNLLGYVYIDLTPANIVLQDNKIKIVDLEPLLPIVRVGNSFFNDRVYPRDYRAYIRQLKYGKKILDKQEYITVVRRSLYLYYVNE